MKVSQLQVNPVYSSSEVTSGISHPDIKACSAVAIGLRSDYHGSTPLQRSPDDTNNSDRRLKPLGNSLDVLIIFEVA